MATSKVALERLKLEVEIRKLNAEAEAAELARDKKRREDRNYAYLDDDRTYHFFGGVSPGTVHECMSTLRRWTEVDPGCDLTIVFNSPGGSVIDGLALYDYLSELKAKGHHLTTVARGMAASMGGVLLQAGDRRIVGINSHLLIHEISMGAIGKLNEIEDEVAFAKMLHVRLLSILAERSELNVDQIKRRWQRKDWWMASDEAVKYGFADEIG